jgi:predicted nucleotidyltransferase component of viral defense system
VIGRADLDDRAREWGLRLDVVEKDYVLGWLLWGIGTDPDLTTTWVFKGGTCLKKCYLETFRFSEDLDFTITPGGPLQPDEVLPRIERILRRVAEESGIDFAIRSPRLRARPGGQTFEGRVYYRGPLGSPQPASIKLDLTGDELVARPTVLRDITHPHADALPAPAQVRCYGFEELFAEKLRALIQRCRPRDLYDVVHLFRRRDLRAEPALIHDILVQKCSAKGIEPPTAETVLQSAHRAELESEWENMLGHQLPALPPLEQFWAEVPTIFGWLAGEILPDELSPLGGDDDQDWRPPPTVAAWGLGVPLEAVRFAGANRLCVQLRYDGRERVIEPYSLRRTRDGNILLHAIRADSGEHRSYRVDRIERVEVTTRAFRPRHVIEFTRLGPITAPPTSRQTPYSNPARRSASPYRSGYAYVIACPACEKTFTRSRNETTLRPHKAPGGWPCTQRRGYLADVK